VTLPARTEATEDEMALSEALYDVAGHFSHLWEVA
jgi:hypothetical protein